MKKILALVLAMLLVLGMTSALADKTTAHVITIDNTDQNVVHTYEGYQIFKGKLNAAETELTDIEWGDGVNGTALLNALKGSTVLVDASNNNLFTDCATPEDVAKVLSTFDSTAGVNQSAGMIDAVARIIAETDGVLVAAKKIPFTAGDKTYTANVVGDGYYFVKDVTTAENLVNNTDKSSDTLSKYLLSVVKDVTITAKDTGLTPDKKILIESGAASAAEYQRVSENSAAIGDIITYEVKLPVPNTKKYEKDFWLKMDDTLAAGLTYLNFVDIKIDGTVLPAANYEVAVKTGNAAFTAPADAAAAVTTVGGQTVEVTFKGFKNYVETNDLIGKDIVLTYRAVLNEKAEMGKTGNENEVEFKYSNNPNHDYDGDWDDSVVGTTPKSKTITYVTALEILKRDGKTKNPLAGAEFQIVSSSYNMVVENGEKFEKIPYTLGTREERVGADDVYYLLKDGTYTKTAKTDQNAQYYVDTTDTYMKVKYTAVVKTPAGNPKTETIISGEDGLITQKGLKPGTYTITETKAPEGYNKIEDTFVLDLKWIDPTDSAATAEQKATGGFYIGEGTTKKDGKYIFTLTSDGAKYEITIDNFGGTALPSTGGIGTTLFYVGGSILVLLAVILLVTKRRMNANND